jgi:ATP/maltotriose-dependent transcriptional regulator MalT
VFPALNETAGFYLFLEEKSINLVQNNDGRLFVLLAQDEGTWFRYHQSF